MWIVFALGASIFWGMCYAVNEQVYRHISVFTSLAIAMTACGLLTWIAAIGTGNWSKDIEVIASNPRVLWLLVAGIVILTIAELFIGFSITGKNATIAGLIEISYPIFIALFSYLFFKESDLNAATFVGAAMVFAGIGVIYAFNR